MDFVFISFFEVTTETWASAVDLGRVLGTHPLEGDGSETRGPRRATVGDSLGQAMGRSAPSRTSAPDTLRAASSRCAVSIERRPERHRGMHSSPLPSRSRHWVLCDHPIASRAILDSGSVVVLLRLWTGRLVVCVTLRVISGSVLALIFIPTKEAPWQSRHAR